MVNCSIYQNLKLLRNDTIKRLIKVFLDGAVQDITGWTFFFTVKTSLDDADGLAQIAVDWTDHLDAENGQTLLNVAKEATNLTGDYYYDIQYKDAAGEVHTIMYGTVNFGKDVTQRTS